MTTIDTGGSIAVEQAAAQFQLQPQALGATAADIVYIPRGGRIDRVQSNQMTIIDAQDLDRCATFEPFKWVKLSVHAHAFGVPQCRPLEFVLFYPPDMRFMCEGPLFDNPWQPCVYDAIWEQRNNTPKRWDLNAPFEYDFQTCIPLADELKEWLPELSNGWSLAEMALLLKASPVEQAKVCPELWDVLRLTWRTGCFSTLQGDPARWIHPWHHRPLMLGEICSIVGVVPELEDWRQRDNLRGLVFNLSRDIPFMCAYWLLRQCLLCLGNQWENYPIEHVAPNGAWYNMLDVRPTAYNLDRFPQETHAQFHNFNWRKWGLK